MFMKDTCFFAVRIVRQLIVFEEITMNDAELTVDHQLPERGNTHGWLGGRVCVIPNG